MSVLRLLSAAFIAFGLTAACTGSTQDPPSEAGDSSSGGPAEPPSVLEDLEVQAERAGFECASTANGEFAQIACVAPVEGKDDEQNLLQPNTTRELGLLADADGHPAAFYYSGQRTQGEASPAAIVSGAVLHTDDLEAFLAGSTNLTWGEIVPGDRTDLVIRSDAESELAGLPQPFIDLTTRDLLPALKSAGMECQYDQPMSDDEFVEQLNCELSERSSDGNGADLRISLDDSPGGSIYTWEIGVSASYYDGSGGDVESNWAQAADLVEKVSVALESTDDQTLSDTLSWTGDQLDGEPHVQTIGSWMVTMRPTDETGRRVEVTTG